MKYLLLLGIVVLFSGCETMLNSVGINTPEQDYQLNLEKSHNKFDKKMEDMLNPNNPELYKTSLSYQKKEEPQKKEDK